jgi:hypothetical protein
MARKYSHTPVSVAVGLPACPDCDALRGDPCRTPGWKTRFPHEGRIRVARIDGIRLWFDDAEVSRGEIARAEGKS